MQTTSLEPDAIRARAAVSAVFFANGFALASWVPHIPVVKQYLGLGDGLLGLVLLAMAAGAVAALAASGALVRRFGSRSATRAAAIGVCLALPLPVLSPTIPLVAASLLIFGACNGALDVAMNAQAVAVERRHARPLMSSFHGLFSTGGLAGAAVAGTATWLGAPARAHVVGAAVAMLALVAAALPSLLRDDAEDGASELAFARPTGAIRTLGLLAFAALVAEGAMADWSAVFLHDVLYAGPALAAAGFAACSTAMAIGRFGGDAAVAAFGATAVLRLSGVLGATGLCVALLRGTPLPDRRLRVGLGIANAIPLIFRRAGNLEGVAPGTGLAATASLGYLGLLSGPPMIGLVAELTTLRVGLGLVVFCTAFLAIAARAFEPPTKRPLDLGAGAESARKRARGDASAGSWPTSGILARAPAGRDRCASSEDAT
jgi:hypothetical protein